MTLGFWQLFAARQVAGRRALRRDACCAAQVIYVFERAIFVANLSIAFSFGAFDDAGRGFLYGGGGSVL